MTQNWPISDHRSAEQLERDSAAVRAQVSNLVSPNGDAAARRDSDAVVERIRRRQLAASDDQATRFVTYTPADGSGPVLCAENRLVVDADAAQAGRLGGLLAGYAAADRAGRSPRRRTRVFRGQGNRSLDALRRDAKRLRDDHGIMAGVNAIVPLGYIVKGNSYPGPTVAPGAFASNGGGAPVRVAIVDTGLTAAPRTDAWDTGVVRNGTDPVNVLAPLDRIDWFAGHGTFAAGIVRQIAPDCEVVVYRFTSTDGLGTDEAAADMMIQAADEAAGGRLIINASFGAPAVDGVPPLAMREAVRYISETYPKTLIVASAGNDGSERPLYPAAFPGVKAVGALNSDLSPAAFSNRGDWVQCSTVGVGVVSTFVEGRLPPEDGIGTDVDFPANSWATWSGTSFTAPQIAGAVAALCGDDGALPPSAAFDQLIAGRPTLDDLGAVVHLLPGTPA
ncbi:S8/S53 family peptidase [Actinoplanes sp. NPDC049118]|uniref:S8 family peptidase n=1 Tax=Actinoplanes sp. NPDC049118 TaxID=3155769 RepID=UPI0033D48C40